MPRFMPVPKLAVAPVSDPSAPTLIGAPPGPCEANSAHESVLALAVVLAAPATVGFGAGAAVGCAAGAEEHAASSSARPPRTRTRTIVDAPPVANLREVRVTLPSWGAAR